MMTILTTLIFKFHSVHVCLCVCAHTRVNWELVITEWMALMEIALLGAGKLNIKKGEFPTLPKVL